MRMRHIYNSQRKLLFKLKCIESSFFPIPVHASSSSSLNAFATSVVDIVLGSFLRASSCLFVVIFVAVDDVAFVFAIHLDYTHKCSDG